MAGVNSQTRQTSVTVQREPKIERHPGPVSMLTRAILVCTSSQRFCFCKRGRIFRDRKNPFNTYDDHELFRKFRFRRQHILELTEDISADVTLANRGSALTSLQVLVTLRYFATSTFQDMCGELVGVDQSTVERVGTLAISAERQEASTAGVGAEHTTTADCDSQSPSISCLWSSSRCSTSAVQAVPQMCSRPLHHGTSDRCPEEGDRTTPGRSSATETARS